MIHNLLFGKARCFGLRVCKNFTPVPDSQSHPIQCNNVQKETMIEGDGLHRNVNGKDGNGDLMRQLAKQGKTNPKMIFRT